jgi:hypothetical protein
MNTAWFQGLLVLGLLLLGCDLAADNQSSDSTLNVRLVDSAATCGGGAAAPRATWIADQDQFQDVYARMKSAVIPGNAAEAPAVDFSREALVLIEMGRKTTGGYFLELKSTKARVMNNSAQVELIWGVPAPDAMVTQVLTSPCILIALPKNGSYTRIQILDQNGRVRLTVPVD